MGGNGDLLLTVRLARGYMFLLLTEHHLEYLDDHRRQGIVPKGLQLERKFNPIIVDGHTAIKSQIEDILANAERRIFKLMHDHHHKLTKVIDKRLEVVEDKIGGITHHPEASSTIHNTIKKNWGRWSDRKTALGWPFRGTGGERVQKRSP